jgi:hypothetical protein
MIASSRFGIGFGLLLAATWAVTVGACGGDKAPESVGSIRLPLTAVSPRGATYRLSNAVFNYTGASTGSLSPPPGQATVTQTLPVGPYTIQLIGGWTLEVLSDGTFAPVTATLISDNPATFSIASQQVTMVRFLFRTSGDVVTFGTGSLEISIAVDDHISENTAATCSDGLDNDGNGLIDCLDPGCGSTPVCGDFCGIPGDCPGQDGECKTRTCLGGACGFVNSAAGMPIASQVPGDCHVSQCDGAGNIVAVTDSTDLPENGNACAAGLCQAGVPVNVPLPAGADCAQNGGSVCDGAGTCVVANPDSPAPNPPNPHQN